MARNWSPQPGLPTDPPEGAAHRRCCAGERTAPAGATSDVCVCRATDGDGRAPADGTLGRRAQEATARQVGLDAERLIADSEAIAVPDLTIEVGALDQTVRDATDGVILSAIIREAGRMADRAGDRPIVAAYLPQVRSTRRSRRSARALTEEMGEEIQQRAMRIMALQMGEQIREGIAGATEGIEEANRGIAGNIADTFEREGYRLSGREWSRRIIIDETVLGGIERETQRVEDYRDFTAPVFAPQVDLSEESLDGMSSRGIQTMIGAAYEEMERYQILIFGRSDDQKDDGTAAMSVEELNGVLEDRFAAAAASWTNAAGYNRTDDEDAEYLHHDIEGLFNYHVGYAPIMKRDNPERVQEAGYGEMGRIMEAFLKNEGRLGRGLAAMEVPVYRQRFWDDDANNDGKPDGLLGAPSVTMVYDIGFAVAASAAGAVVSTVTGNTATGAAVSTAISMTDDAIFTSLDIAVGAQDADDAWEAFGKKAAATLMTNLISGGLGEVVNVGSTLVGHAAMAGIQYTASTTTSAAINSLEWNSNSFFDIDFNTDTFQDATMSEEALAGLAGAMVGAGVTGGLDGIVDGTIGSEYMEVAALNRTIGSATNAATQYAMTGQTTLNVLNMSDFGGPASTGLLELNLGGNRPVFNIGMGGIGMSVGQVMQGMGGFSSYRRSLDIHREGFRGEEAIAMRMLDTSGLAETEALYEELMAGDATMVKGGTDGRAETQIVNGEKLIFLGEGASSESRYQLGLTLTHEAFRDGVDNGEVGQQQETVRAVVGHTLVAQQIAGIYGDEQLTGMQQDEVERLVKAQQTGDFSGFASYVGGAYDSSSDYWKLTAQGELVFDGDGYLKDEEGMYINEDGSRTSEPTNQTIGAEGIETGLLNILNGGTSNVAYGSFTDAQVPAAQQLMYGAGMMSSSGDPRDVLWNTGSLNGANMDKTLDMRDVMGGFGDQVATEVFVNYFYDEAHAVVAGSMAGTYAGSPIGATAGLSNAGVERFGELSGALRDFYQGGLDQASGLASNYPNTQGFGPSSLTDDDGEPVYPDGVHKGVDFGMTKGTAIPAIFSGRINGIDAAGVGSSGIDVGMSLGFRFEDTFIDTGVDAQAFHFSSLGSLTNGGYIDSGYTLGFAGNTGLSVGDGGGYHLHQQMTIPERYGIGAGLETYVNPYKPRMEGVLDMIGAASLYQQVAEPLDLSIPLTNRNDTIFSFDGQSFLRDDRDLMYLDLDELFR